jgi:sialate O-acetylesterase
MKKTILSAIFCLSLSCSLKANVKLPAILADSMVIQRDTRVNIWGWADPGEIITVTASWLKSPVTTAADSSGRWMVKVKTTRSGKNYSISIEGKNKILLKNILMGEVWLCSGQSNMEFTIENLGGWNIYKKEKQELEEKDFSQIRFCQIPKTVSDNPADTCGAAWSSANVNTVLHFSATAYFFGRALFNKLHVPIGLISSNWGGTPAEAWTEKSYLENDKELQFYNDKPNGWKPAALYNGMIHPIVNYSIRGAIWYQGEANRNDADLYRKLFVTMIRNWREAWKEGDFPFYYVQIAPFRYDEPFPSSAYLREAQLQTLSVPNTGMAVTMDIGETENIHPKNKQEVGKRLALWALAKTYHSPVGSFSGPLYKRMKLENNKIRIFFDYARGGLLMKGNKLTGFTIAGNGGKFIDADAAIDKNTVVVWNGTISNPVAARFAFTNTDSSVLFNKAGLPASSFRTDSIPFFVRSVKFDIQPGTSQPGSIVAMECSGGNYSIRYTTDGMDPTIQSPIYTSPVILDTSVHIKARAYKNGVASPLVSEIKYLKHLGTGKSITIANKCSDRYTGGNNALLDGIRGSTDFRDGHWQGYQVVDLDCVIDLKDTTTIHSIGTDFLENTQSWIFLPKEVEYSSSMDGTNFIPLGKIEHPIPAGHQDVNVKMFTTKVDSVKARYIRVIAKNIGQCPSWHPGAGQKAWIFADEIIIE